MSAKHYGARRPSGEKDASNIIGNEAAYQLIAWAHPDAFLPGKYTTTQALPDYTYFDDFGMVISRGKQIVPFSIAIKAGHNAENHNHSDVGTYTIVLDRNFVTGDIGAPSYTAGAFAPDNKARSSWGHPVPRIEPHTTCGSSTAFRLQEAITKSPITVIKISEYNKIDFFIVNPPSFFNLCQRNLRTK